MKQLLDHHQWQLEQKTPIYLRNNSLIINITSSERMKQHLDLLSIAPRILTPIYLKK
jgi:hypothetical protein